MGPFYRSVSTILSLIVADYCEVVTTDVVFFMTLDGKTFRMGAVTIVFACKSPFPAICASVSHLFSFVMLDNLKRAAFVTQLRILPKPVIQSFVLTAKKPVIWLAIVPLPNHLARKCPFSWTTITETLPDNTADNTPPVPSPDTPTDNNDQSLEISQLAQQLPTSSTKWKATLLLLPKNIN